MYRVTLLFVLFVFHAPAVFPQRETIDAASFLSLVTEKDRTTKEEILSNVEANWNEAYEIMLLEVYYLSNDHRFNSKVLRLLEKKSGKRYGTDVNKWYEYLWNKPEKLTEDYHEFKSGLHRLIDPKFNTYFLNRQQETTIRWDEIRWGGVKQDGIPPLRNPKMIAAKDARYLKDDHIVFGIAVNGDVRAYPKRILAWHEMFVDTVGGIPVAGVYCTLCGTVILYKTEHNGIQHQMGTSGFLYRSNKLMYDKATQSLWNTLWGTPVVGPLVGKGIELEYLSVVTTTWGEWKQRHPETNVLSLNTGHHRNYNEGAAYRDYFSTDRLMFNVPSLDNRLKNKQSILAIRLLEYPNEPVAIDTDFLSRNPLYPISIRNQNLIVLTDQSGANRVYDLNGVSFVSYDRNSRLKDSKGIEWKLIEDALIGPDGDTLTRVRSFNAFWFGWKAAFPDTKLIK